MSDTPQATATIDGQPVKVFGWSIDISRPPEPCAVSIETMRCALCGKNAAPGLSQHEGQWVTYAARITVPMPKSIEVYLGKTIVLACDSWSDPPSVSFIVKQAVPEGNDRMELFTSTAERRVPASWETDKQETAPCNSA